MGSNVVPVVCYLLIRVIQKPQENRFVPLCNLTIVITRWCSTSCAKLYVLYHLFIVITVTTIFIIIIFNAIYGTTHGNLVLVSLRKYDVYITKQPATTTVFTASMYTTTSTSVYLPQLLVGRELWSSFIWGGFEHLSMNTTKALKQSRTNQQYG